MCNCMAFCVRCLSGNACECIFIYICICGNMHICTHAVICVNVCRFQEACLLLYLNGKFTVFLCAVSVRFVCFVWGWGAGLGWGRALVCMCVSAWYACMHTYTHARIHTHMHTCTSYIHNSRENTTCIPASLHSYTHNIVYLHTYMAWLRLVGSLQI